MIEHTKNLYWNQMHVSLHKNKDEKDEQMFKSCLNRIFMQGSQIKSQNIEVTHRCVCFLLFFFLSIYAQPSIPATWTLIEDDFEGTLADWDKVPASNPAAQPQLIAAEGMAGSTGLGVEVGTGESYLYQSDLMPADSGALRFWFHPNSVTIPDEGNWIPAKSFRIADIKGGASWHIIAALRVRQSGGNYYGFLEWRDPQAGTRYDYADGEFSIINDWQKITLEYEIDTVLRVRINDILVREITNVQHTQAAGSIVEVGKAGSNSTITPSGRMYYDLVSYQIPDIPHLYVNQSGGNDQNDGRTPVMAFASIQAAADIAGPGTVVHIAAGIYNEAVRPQYSGKATLPVTYQSEADIGEVVIDGTDIDLNGWGGLFRIDGKQHIRLDGLAFQNSTWAGIMCTRCEHVDILNCTTYDTRSSGIYISDAAFMEVNGNDIRRAVNGGTQECLSVSHCHDFELSYNKVHDGVGLALGGEGIDVKTHCYSGSVHHNHVYDLPGNYDPAIHEDGEVGIYIDAYSSSPPDHLYDVHVYNNVVSTPVGIAVGAEQGGTVENVHVYNNIVYNCYSTGISITNWVSPYTGVKKRIYVLNNTVYGCGHFVGAWPVGGGIYLESRVPEDEDIIISNNLLSQNIGYQLKAHPDALDNLIAEFNLIDDLVGADAYEISGDFPVFGDPEFFDAENHNFSLLATSAAIDTAGSAHAPDFDYENRSRPLDGDRDGTAAVDVGACEFDPSLYPFIQITAVLEGAYDPADGNMQKGLAYGPLPNRSPYAANPRQVQDIPENAIDWILVGFKSPSGDIAVKDTSLFLNSDGMIMDEHANTEIAMTGLATGSYLLFLQHRNHLSVQTRSLLACEGGETSGYDFSSGRGQYFSPAASKELATGVWGLVAGDCNQDGSITSADYVYWYNERTSDPKPYAVSDLNLDGEIDTQDYAAWLINCRNACANQQIH
ncbi:hypothetical protein GF407_03505 [candidate division KSB1 bacterium]|nr:hypothetical protein [candidate division KSB1 bacterium]